MMNAKYELEINETFKNLISSLTEDEYQSLENSILVNGYDESYPIITWRNTIIDGHNRYEICQKHNITNYTISEKQFENEHEVINWIICNQINRRNLNEDQKAYLIGTRYNNEKRANGGDRKSVDNTCTLKSTADTIAEEMHVSPGTVKNNGDYATAVDILTGIDYTVTRQCILSGILLVSRTTLENISKLEPAIQKELFNARHRAPYLDIGELYRKYRTDMQQQCDKILVKIKSHMTLSDKDTQKVSKLDSYMQKKISDAIEKDKLSIEELETPKVKDDIPEVKCDIITEEHTEVHEKELGDIIEEIENDIKLPLEKTTGNTEVKQVELNIDTLAELICKTIDDYTFNLEKVHINDVRAAVKRSLTIYSEHNHGSSYLFREHRN